MIFSSYLGREYKNEVKILNFVLKGYSSVMITVNFICNSSDSSRHSLSLSFFLKHGLWIITSKIQNSLFYICINKGVT